MLERIAVLGTRARVLIPVVTALIVLLLTWGRVELVGSMIAAWDAFAFCFLALTWMAILGFSIDQIRKAANIQDAAGRFVFAFAIVAACASLFAVTLLLRTAKQFQGPELLAHLALSVAAVAGSWGLIHTIFTLRYAHIYYDDEECSGHDAPGETVGGLEFPNESRPDYVDFAYFSFVIGMTFQVSDVVITARRIRRLALLHGVVSFAFNTMILALSLNIITGLV